MDRRGVLTLCASLSLITSTGCLGRFRSESPDGGDNELEGYVSPERDPDKSPLTLECDPLEDEAYERHPRRYETIQLGETEHFSLRVDARSFGYGETAVITLQNNSSETQQRGGRDEFNIEVSTREGWQDVRVWTADRPLVYSDVAFQIEPGERTSWEIELSEDGITERSKDGLEVCPSLTTGRYRFTFPALLSDDDIAVEFDLTRDV